MLFVSNRKYINCVVDDVEKDAIFVFLEFPRCYRIRLKLLSSLGRNMCIVNQIGMNGGHDNALLVRVEVI
jgi:hypothetical protein